MFTPHKREVELLQKLRFPGVVELAVAVAVIVAVVVDHLMSPVHVNLTRQ